MIAALALLGIIAFRMGKAFRGSQDDGYLTAAVARQCGAWVPFLRDPTVAKDTTPTIETICSDRARLEALGEAFDTFCLLQPTTPFCSAEDIAGAIAIHEKVHAGVVSVMRTKARPMLLRTLDAENRATSMRARSAASFGFWKK